MEPSLSGRCYRCFRPKAECFCAAIPHVDNTTHVLILQHARERFHPFNTARIVEQALGNSQLLVGHNPELAAARLPLRPRAGLLYPGPRAQILSDLVPEEYPQQLVILDGTWHHTKTMLRDIRALEALPRYALAPREPGRYRIRREPTATSLSTLEAVAAALEIIEPETRGLDRLIEAFNTMVERQLAHPKAPYGWRSNRRRSRTALNIPRALIHDLDNVVVAYGEAAPRDPRQRHGQRLPVYWVAERLGSAERFVCAIEPAAPLSDVFLGHLELAREDFSGALAPDQFRAAWAAFLRPGDSLAVYHHGTARLLAAMGGDATGCLVLKAVDLRGDRLPKELEEGAVAQDLLSGPSPLPGRAGRRLARTATWARQLAALGAACS